MIKLRNGAQCDVEFKEVFVYENGIMSLKNAVKKVPQSDNVDYVIELETNTIAYLNKLKVPHVVRLLNVVCEKTQESKKSSDETEYFDEEIMYTLYSGKTLSSHKTTVMEYDEFISLIASVLATCASLASKGVSHNDLHSDNVTLKSCEHDYRRYIFPDGKIMTVKSFGREPRVIDFGYAYCDTRDDVDCPLFIPPFFTDVGICLWWHDPLGDRVKFLKSVAKIIQYWQTNVDETAVDDRLQSLKMAIIKTYTSKFLKNYLYAHLYLLHLYLRELVADDLVNRAIERKAALECEDLLLSAKMTAKDLCDYLNKYNRIFADKSIPRQFIISDGTIELMDKCQYTVNVYEQDVTFRLDKILVVDGVETKCTDKCGGTEFDVCYQGTKFDNVLLKLAKNLQPSKSKLFTGEYALDAVALLVNQLGLRDVAVNERTTASTKPYSLSLLFHRFEQLWKKKFESKCPHSLDKLVCLKQFLNDHRSNKNRSDIDRVVELLLVEIRQFIIDRGVAAKKKMDPYAKRVNDSELVRFIFNEADVSDASPLASFKYYTI